MKDTSLLFDEDSYCVSSDSSFCISFIEGLKRKDWLFFFINRYHFYLGERLLGELSTSPASDPAGCDDANGRKKVGLFAK